jgi:hypothetical protein
MKSQYLITNQDENTIEGYHEILGYVVFHKKLETLYQKLLILGPLVSNYK